MLRPRDEGSGGTDGIVLNMTLSGDGIWDAVYSVQAFVGKDQQPVMLSVDTGSSDLWVASTSCSTLACTSSQATLYNPSTSLQTGRSVNISYLRGDALGPIVWDAFKLGAYTIPSQALAAASQVIDETLSPKFVGLMGLALPFNSLIANQIPPTEGDAPDGATVQENLFGLTPVNTAPSRRFFGLSLERPGSSRIPSLLGIGRHPSSLVPGFDPSSATLMDLVGTIQGDTFWRVSVESITGWVDGTPKPVALPRSSVLGTVDFPVAIVDTGGSGILTTRDIANGIYGAWQIGPASDGNYYVPCTTPMNMSIGLGRLPPIPLHPLDITAPVPSSSTSSITCRGLIQASDSLGATGAADLILGVPFLRNVYSILSLFPAPNITNTSTPAPFPRLGLIPLTDPATALDEFHSVRILGQPLDPIGASPPQNASVTVGKKLNVGIIVLIGIVGFFAVCGLMFGVRWWVLRRRFKREGAEKGEGAVEDRKVGEAGGDVEMDEEALRQKKWEEGKKKGLFYAESSTGSDWTRVDPAWVLEDRGSVARYKKGDGEKGKEQRSRSSAGSADLGLVVQDPRLIPAPGEGDGANDSWGALSPFHARNMRDASRTPSVSTIPLLDEGEWSPERAGYPMNARERFLSTSTATWSHERQPSMSSATVTFQDDLDMAGVGARGSVASSARRVARPRFARTASGSGGSGSWRGSEWSGEVGEVMESRGREAEVEAEGVASPVGQEVER